MFHSWISQCCVQSPPRCSTVRQEHGFHSRELPAKWLALHALAEFLRKQQINVIIDVGANEGQFVTKVRRLGYDGLIVSFEPDPRSFSVLSSRNAGDRRWRGISVALGNTEADLVLHQTHDSVLSSLLTPLRTQNLKSDVQVHVQRLDQLFDQLVSSTYAPRVLLKTDTQGFDLEVLKGASSSLPRIPFCKPVAPLTRTYRSVPG